MHDTPTLSNTNPATFRAGYFFSPSQSHPMDAATTVNKRIPFKAVGNLPAPDDLPAPTIFVPFYHPFGKVDYGSVRVMDEDHSERKTNYSFTPMNPQDGWTEWMAIGWEDCEIGRITVSARGPNKKTYLWDILIAHDGDPRREFWGWDIEKLRPAPGQ